MRPPRIPNWLSIDRETIYFVTICVADRRAVLNLPHVWETFLKVWERLDRWTVIAAVAMPDHLHLLITPRINRDESLSAFLKWFKRWTNGSLQPDWKWMDGAFDRLLRRDENVSEKWEYIRQNPVRAGLVRKPEDWPYQVGLE